MHPIPPDDIARQVYGVLGIPIDVIEMSAVLGLIRKAAVSSGPLLISTVNVNFLVISQSDEEFRESLLRSDLCAADGMPIVWIAWLLGVPIKERIAGSDIFEALKFNAKSVQRLSVFLFGGIGGSAAAACARLNGAPSGVICAGSYEPGFGTVEEMSTEEIIGSINSSSANFLAAALGAKKGQAWLLRNHNRLRIPVRVHLGATINFQAGTLKRAPRWMHKWGLEWLWRIKEEPQLWRRYWGDGIALLHLLLAQVLPLVLLSRWYRLTNGHWDQAPIITRAENHKSVILSINGNVTAQNLGNVVSCFQDVAEMTKDVAINFAETRLIDARFLGLLLMLRKRLKEKDLRLDLTGVSGQMARLFRLNGFDFLL